MEVLSKVSINPFICAIELDFSGNLTPNNSNVPRSFFNSLGNSLTWEEAYFGKKTVSLKETSKNVAAGTQYTQKLSIKFPSTDINRSERIYLFNKVKFVKIVMNTGLKLVLGRNDFFQNKKPAVTASSTTTHTIITFTSNSIFPIGTVDEVDITTFGDNLLPNNLPISFINT